MKVYLSGPMSGLTEEVFRQRFAAAGRQVATMFPKTEVIDPCDIPPGPLCDHDGCERSLDAGGHSWACWLRGDIKQLVACTAIAMLPGWETSPGAVAERGLAVLLGLVVIELPAAQDDVQSREGRLAQIAKLFAR